MRAKSLKPELTYYDIAEGITAFSSTRHGGYSEGTHGEFNVNLYCGDTPEAITANRKALCQLLRIKTDRLVMPHQVHTTGIAQIGRTFFRLSEEVRRQVLEGIDALMTNIPGVCIGVSTADCIPIIIYDPEHRAASVVHSEPPVPGLLFYYAHRNQRPAPSATRCGRKALWELVSLLLLFMH